MKKIVFLMIGLLLLIGEIGKGSGGAETQNSLKMVGAVFQTIESGGVGKPAIRKTVMLTDVSPGTELSYVVTHRNTGNQPVKDAVITHEVPEELEYISTSSIKTGVNNATFEVSVDGGKSYGDISRLFVTPPGGESRSAKARDVTAVRWILHSEVAAGEDAFIYIRGKAKP